MTDLDAREGFPWSEEDEGDARFTAEYEDIGPFPASEIKPCLDGAHRWQTILSVTRCIRCGLEREDGPVCERCGEIGGTPEMIGTWVTDSETDYTDIAPGCSLCPEVRAWTERRKPA